MRTVGADSLAVPGTRVAMIQKRACIAGRDSPSPIEQGYSAMATSKKAAPKSASAKSAAAKSIAPQEAVDKIAAPKPAAAKTVASKEIAARSVAPKPAVAKSVAPPVAAAKSVAAPKVVAESVAPKPAAAKTVASPKLSKKAAPKKLAKAGGNGAVTKRAKVSLLAVVTPSVEPERSSKAPKALKLSSKLMAEQTRETQEKARAKNAQASIRDTMVRIGRGNQQAGRQGGGRGK